MMAKLAAEKVLKADMRSGRRNRKQSVGKAMHSYAQEISNYYMEKAQFPREYSSRFNSNTLDNSKT